MPTAAERAARITPDGVWRRRSARIAREGAETIAACFVEPVQGAGGVIVPPDGYLSELRELCRRHEILFVADEVITGFGRLGAWFASGLWELDPDLMTMAKGITSGYLPLGATLVSDEIAAAIEAGGTLAHGFTYTGHPTACAAALANLDVIERERLVERVRTDVGPRFQAALHALEGHPAVAEVRGFGLIGALELKRPARGPCAEAAPNTLGLAAHQPGARGGRDRARDPRPGRARPAAGRDARRAGPHVRGARARARPLLGAELRLCGALPAPWKPSPTRLERRPRAVLQRPANPARARRRGERPVSRV